MKRRGPNPTLSDFIDARIKLAMASMNCVSIGTIQEFDEVLQQATVSLNYKRIIKDGAMAANNIDTVDVIKEYPLLMKCPAIVLGGGVAHLTFPIAKGDPCVVFFADRDMDTWIETGVVDSPPNSERVHSLSDAIALVGINTNSNPLAAFNTLIASLLDKTGERLSQAGDVKATARTTAPSGWLLCYGQAISRTTYDLLFAAIGTTYGAGDGTTFNLPDLRGRTIVGLDNMGGSQAGVLTSADTPNRNVLGGAVGEETHLLTGRESGIQLHTHTIIRNTDAGGGLSISGSGNNGTTNTGATGHTDAIDRHNNVQPGMMLNWIIKI